MFCDTIRHGLMNQRNFMRLSYLMMMNRFMKMITMKVLVSLSPIANTELIVHLIMCLITISRKYNIHPNY